MLHNHDVLHLLFNAASLNEAAKLAGGGSHPKVKLCYLVHGFFGFWFFKFIFERQRQSASGGGAERERETQNPKKAPGSDLSAQEPDTGLELKKQRDHDLSQSRTLDQRSHPGAPFYFLLFYF